MKKLINPFKGFVFLVFALAPLLTMASDNDNIEKKKTISKNYTVNADDRLEIDNSFGDVTITTWDKNEVHVDIEIGVRATTDEKAQKMIDQIEVKDYQNGSDISFKTEIGRMSGNKNNGNDGIRKFYVDYKISMPSRNRLRIENQFGKILIPDFTGAADITSKFGELTTGKMQNAKLIHVEFGKADVGQLTNADVIFKFNNSTSVAGLSGNSKVDVQFCNNVNIAIDNTATELSIFQSYSTINLQVPVDLSANFNVHTNFGSFKNKTSFSISEEEQDESSGPKFDKDYSGKAGAGSTKIKIKSSFGSIRLANDRMNEKEKNKDEKVKNKNKNKDKNNDDDDDDDDDKDEKDNSKVDL